MIYSQYVDLSNIHQSTGNFLSFVVISVDFLYAGQKARYISSNAPMSIFKCTNLDFTYKYEKVLIISLHVSLFRDRWMFVLKLPLTTLLRLAESNCC